MVLLFFILLAGKQRNGVDDEYLIVGQVVEAMDELIDIKLFFCHLFPIFYEEQILV